MAIADSQILDIDGLIEDAMYLFFDNGLSIPMVAERTQLPESLLNAALVIKKPRIRRFSPHSSNGPWWYFGEKKVRFGKREMMIISILENEPERGMKLDILYKKARLGHLYDKSGENIKATPPSIFKVLLDCLERKGVIKYSCGCIYLTEKGGEVLGAYYEEKETI